MGMDVLLVLRDEKQMFGDDVVRALEKLLNGTLRVGINFLFIR